MCELFAMSSLAPASFRLSLGQLAMHSKPEEIHRDGWGIAFYEDHDAQVFRDTKAAYESPLSEYISQTTYRSQIVLSHIRKATIGKISLANTQPFLCRMGGRAHVFAHNGDLENVETVVNIKNTCYQPVGETDSEIAFSELLNNLAGLWCQREIPTLDARFEVISALIKKIKPLGPANFIYADSDALFVYAHQRTQPNGFIESPGMYLLERQCERGGIVDAGGFSLTSSKRTPVQNVVLVASVPLTEETWTPLEESQLLVIRKGIIKKTAII